MLTYTWTRKGDFYTFTSARRLEAADFDELDAHLLDVKEWFRTGRVREQKHSDWDLLQQPNQYRMTIQRSVITATQHAGSFTPAGIHWEGSTQFHPPEVKVQIVLHEDKALMFRMAFELSDERV